MASTVLTTASLDALREAGLTSEQMVEEIDKLYQEHLRQERREAWCEGMKSAEISKTVLACVAVLLVVVAIGFFVERDIVRARHDDAVQLAACRAGDAIVCADAVMEQRRLVQDTRPEYREKHRDRMRIMRAAYAEATGKRLPLMEEE